MKIMFMFAHLDDEAFGPAGTIAKLAKTNEVMVVSLCAGRFKRDAKRMNSFIHSCNNILQTECKIYTNIDLTLKVEDARDNIEHAIHHFKPDAVYTHNISDIHQDHRLTSEVCLVACRPMPGSSVKEFYMCEQLASTGWGFNQFGTPFEPNVYVDITSTHDAKMQSLELYAGELREYPDARSIQAIEELSKYRGKQVGVQYAESFKQIFRQC